MVVWGHHLPTMAGHRMGVVVETGGVRNRPVVAAYGSTATVLLLLQKTSVPGEVGAGAEGSVGLELVVEEGLVNIVGLPCVAGNSWVALLLLSWHPIWRVGWH
jgi:hypothetical protein